MKDKGLTTMNVRTINRNRVYNYIYQKKTTYKQQIVAELEMGLSTVSHNLKLLEEDGLILREGFFDSTGGRKAQKIQINPQFRMAVGIGLQKHMIHLAVIDLYGTSVHQETVAFDYYPENGYYRQLGLYLEEFLQKNKVPKEKLLGVTISTQGIISSDGTSVDYGVLIDNSNMKLANFQEYIPYPCRLEHDSKAAAYLESWNHRELRNAIVFLLNRNLGGALILEGNVHQGTHMHSGTIEHLCMDREGPLCYCGQRGCLETYCSANALAKKAGMEIPDFFQALRGEQPSENLKDIWKTYLEDLALAIRNLNMVFDGAVIISGYLAPYFQREDTLYLLQKINASTPFPLKEEQMLLGTHGQYTPAIGGALCHVKEFMTSV